MGTNLMSLARSGDQFLKLYGDRKMVRTLPYDAEVEWIGGDKNSWIDTGLIANSNLSVEIDFFAVGSGSDFTMGAISKDSPYVRYHFGNGNTDYGVGEVISSDGEFNVRHVNKMIPSLGYFIDGIKKKSFNQVFDIGISYWIFGRNSLNKTLSTLGTHRIFSAKFYNEDVICEDLIPVRFTNSLGQTEGAMYDRVSGQLFCNAGTGAFIIGPDKTI